MWADTEIRRDLIRGWRDQALEVWAETYCNPPVPDFEEAEFPDLYELWLIRKATSRMEIALGSRDLDLAREIPDVCDRTTVEVAIHDRGGNFDEIRALSERAKAIDNPAIRGSVTAGLCFGVTTRAWAFDLGLLGQALSIPSDFSHKDAAIASVVRTLGRPDLLRWVQPSQTVRILADIARQTGDREICRRAMEAALIERELSIVRKASQAIAKTGDLPLNEWAMRRLLGRESAEERAFGFAALSAGPLRDWAFEFGLSDCELIGDDDRPGVRGTLHETFLDLWPYPGRKKEFALAELAVTRQDPDVTERMLDDEIRYLTLARIGIDSGDPEPIGRLDDPHQRARALTEFARRHRDEAAILEASRQLEKVERSEDYLDTLLELISVFGDLRPVPSSNVRTGSEAKSEPQRRRRNYPGQLSLPLEI